MIYCALQVSDNHVWAERYDRELLDIFAVQDQVTPSIDGVLAVELEGKSPSRAQLRATSNGKALAPKMHSVDLTR